MYFTYKYRIYPNNEQKNLILRTFGCCRYVYNYFLSESVQKYNNDHTRWNVGVYCKLLTQLKSENTWLKEVDSTALQSSIRNLDSAYKNFFRQSSDKVGFPHYKSKKAKYESYTTIFVKGNIAVEDNCVKIPRVGKIKCRVSRDIHGRILHATISHTPSDKYYVAICCYCKEPERMVCTGKNVGVDLGVKTLAVTSDGAEYANNKFFNQSLAKLRRNAHLLSRKQLGSNRYEKQRVKVARIMERVANQRIDSINKVTTSLVRNYDVICIENLKTKGMTKNHNLARSILDASFFEFRRQLEYKTSMYGRTLSIVNTFFPSSQLCHCCYYRNKDTKDLKLRKWICPQCGASHDRDRNAAINILNEGLRIIN